MGMRKGYGHWSATPYSWLGNEYHTVINRCESHLFPGHIQNEDKDFPGVWIHRMTPYTTDLHSHTYGRNTNSFSVSIACMGNDPRTGKSGFDAYPPTPDMVEVFCKEVAKVALGLKWEASPGYLESAFLTHAEAAGLRDYPIKLVRKAPGKDNDVKARTIGDHGIYLPHDNYGPSHWKGAYTRQDWPGGTCDKWDLWQLSPKDVGGIGGYLIRDKVISWMKRIGKLKT